ncbi:hypothetical protein GOQ27_15855 [Clostridium sp. D2Q-11]|uniref:Uncharacterized protein n=1 Tax=Anaeromonas frigoriresistens TaxID=2683708 RepID=A0A942UZM5_9FIRM|nr:hypothetical protein [Anaeromonas frigoriresistens]MBS4539951.1 hypothetical protein [Anaeromonas frigoriresistens]
MIQIDDAGSGSLIGGTIIGAMRCDTKEYYYKIIPLELYNFENFKQKKYLDYVVDITVDLFNSLNVSKEEKILVCRGYMFDNLRKWLKDNNYNFTSTKIYDPLQNIIEKSFEDYTLSLGFPKEIISYTKYPFHFHRILKWVYSDYDKRKKLCKVGWKSWQKYKNLNLEITYEEIKKSNYLCLKCNKVIDKNSKVKIINYTSNRPDRIILHHKC